MLSRREEGTASNLALHPIHCGTFTELASHLRSVFLNLENTNDNSYLLLIFALTVETKLMWEIALKST